MIVLFLFYGIAVPFDHNGYLTKLVIIEIKHIYKNNVKKF